MSETYMVEIETDDLEAAKKSLQDLIRIGVEHGARKEVVNIVKWFSDFLDTAAPMPTTAAALHAFIHERVAELRKEGYPALSALARAYGEGMVAFNLEGE